MRKQILTEKAPAAIGPYSQAIEANGFLFISGQLPIDAKTGKSPSDIKEQAELCLKNLEAIADEAGTKLSEAVKISVYLKDIADFKVVNEAYTNYFIEPFPARIALQAACLPLDSDIEIDAVIPLISGLF